MNGNSDTGAHRIRTMLPLTQALPTAAIAAAAAVQLGWRLTGSIAAADWLGTALVVALLLSAVLLSGGAALPSRPALAAIGGLLAYAAWVALSLRWSPVPTLGKEEAQLILLYALTLAVPLVTLRGPRERVAALAALALVPGGITVAAALELVTAGEPQALFGDGRLEFPVSYANANAALFLLGLWPALALAAGRALPVALRAGALAAASACLAGWIATQSKGGAVGLAASAVAVFALSPGRLRLALPALLAAAPSLALTGPLTEPYRSRGLPDAAAGTGRSLLLATAVALVAGAAYAALDRRDLLSERAVRLARRVAAVSLVILAVVAASLLVATTGRPDRSLASGWDAFSEYHPDEGGSGTHLATLGGSNRYDFWRVSLEGTAGEPVLGVGARGFGAVYLQEGRSHETPARAHSLVFDTLLEGGAVGLALLVVALGIALWLVAVAARQRRLHGVAALGGCVGWLAHASVDWVWTFPATGLLFFLLLGVGCTRDGPLVPRRASVAAGAATALAGLALLGAPWLSARLAERALAQPERAGADLAWARRLDPISVYPYFVEAAVAPDRRAALAPLERATEKEPESVATRYALGLALLDAGERERARAELAAAVRLAPGNPIVQAAFDRAR